MISAGIETRTWVIWKISSSCPPDNFSSSNWCCPPPNRMVLYKFGINDTAGVDGVRLNITSLYFRNSSVWCLQSIFSFFKTDCPNKLKVHSLPPLHLLFLLQRGEKIHAFPKDINAEWNANLFRFIQFGSPSSYFSTLTIQPYFPIFNVVDFLKNISKILARLF